jgi:Xaa-Pro dipeptidase
VTIEPGIYFIPSLLEPLRQRRESRLLDWTLIDRLTNHGGVRIEDDVLVTKEQAEDLTRPLIPGHSD